MGILGRGVVAAVAAASAVPATAAAATEISDPCGVRDVSTPALVAGRPSPLLPSVDICLVRMSGVPGEGPLRALQTAFLLDGDPVSGGGGVYTVRAQTERCQVEYKVMLYQGGQGWDVSAGGHCGYRPEPCPPPVSELSNVGCGSYQGEFHLWNPDAVTATVTGKLVTLTFDPNELPDGMHPSLSGDLSPAGEPSARIRYKPLVAAHTYTLIHTGVKGYGSSGTGVGADGTPPVEPVPLD